MNAASSARPDGGHAFNAASSTGRRYGALPLRPPYDLAGWGAVFAPAGTPPGIVAKLSTAIAFLHTELAKWAKLAQEAGIQPE